MERLDTNILVLNRYPTSLVNIQAFTDSLGSLEYNFSLAKRRAMSVVQYLRKQGIHSSRIVVSPLGESLPLIVTNQDQAVATNRRVELMLLDTNGRPQSIRLDVRLRLEAEFAGKTSLVRS